MLTRYDGRIEKSDRGPSSATSRRLTGAVPAPIVDAFGARCSLRARPASGRSTSGRTGVVVSRAGELRWHRFVRTAARPSATTRPCASGARRDWTPARPSRRPARARAGRVGRHLQEGSRSEPRDAIGQGRARVASRASRRIPQAQGAPGPAPISPRSAPRRNRGRSSAGGPPSAAPQYPGPPPLAGTSPELPRDTPGRWDQAPPRGAPSGVRGWMIRMLGGKPEAPAPSPRSRIIRLRRPTRAIRPRVAPAGLSAPAPLRASTRPPAAKGPCRRRPTRTAAWPQPPSPAIEAARHGFEFLEAGDLG